MSFVNIWEKLRICPESKEAFINRLFVFVLCFLMIGGILTGVVIAEGPVCAAVLYSLGFSILVAHVCAVLAFTGVLRFSYGVNEILDELEIEVVE